MQSQSSTPDKVVVETPTAVAARYVEFASNFSFRWIKVQRISETNLGRFPQYVGQVAPAQERRIVVLELFSGGWVLTSKNKVAN